MVNTFIVGDFEFTAKTLDSRRKLKQAVECIQIINIIADDSVVKSNKGFKNHPAVLMWKPYLNALKLYYNIFIKELKKNKVNLIKMQEYEIIDKIEMPWFITFEPLINSHKARLYQKDPFYYKDKFSFPEEYLTFGYIWPTRYDLNFYLSYNYNIKDIADPLNKLYINTRYCDQILKSGKRKGEQCNNIIKIIDNKYCGVHQRYIQHKD